jgi:predicted DNA-binding transcriptional regulator
MIEIFPLQDDVQRAVCDWLLPYLKPPPAVIHATKKSVMGNIKPLEKALDFERYTVSTHSECK